MTPLVSVSRRLSEDLDAQTFVDPVAYVYDPLTYARRAHEAYLERYGRGRKEVLFLGMNPGPFGMAQTGVPFGDVAMVRDYLGIEEPVDEVVGVHPKRPVEGFACPRSEVSGTRFWGFVASRFPKPERFFERAFVWNYCPLLFLEASGRNRTPDKLSAAEREPLYAVCDEALRSIVRALEPRWVIGVGAFGRDRAEAVLGTGFDVKVGMILHPSPASPKANHGWAEAAARELASLGVAL